MVERRTNPLPKSLVEKPDVASSQKETSISGVSPQTQAFLRQGIENQAYQELEARTRNLIGIYFGTDATLDDLREIANVNSRERVRQLIRRGMEDLWQALPPALKVQYPKETVIQLKKEFSHETRARMSEARKGRTHSAKTRARMSEACKRMWQNPAFREKVIKAQKERWARKKGG